MIDKADFYHGAALVRVLEDSRCESVKPAAPRYLVNGRSAVCVKYTTKAHSPWRFTLTADDVGACNAAVSRSYECVVAFVCGGDGVCAVRWEQIRRLIGGAPRWIACRRAFNGSYSVAGPNGVLDRKVALSQWPGLLYAED